MKVAVGQFSAGLDVHANLGQCVALMAAGANEGADLVVLPEASMYFDPQLREPRGYAEPVDGPFVTHIREAAKQRGISVVVGMSEPAQASGRYNTLVAIGSDGSVLGTYRKIHLYDAFGVRESDHVTPGVIGVPLVFSCGDFRVGAATCYDLRFPEIFRWLVDAGADAIVLPAAWVAGPQKELQWETLVRARAIENTVYLVASGQTGPVNIGQSLIVDPLGAVIAGAGLEPGLASARIEHTQIDAVRARNPSLANRRFTVRPLS